MSGYPTTDTFGSLVDETITSLQGWGVNTDQMATLNQPIDADDLVLQVSEANIVSRGIIEIDEEVIWVQTAQNGQLSVPVWGRGWKGTTAAAHAAGAAVYVSPTYPRAIVSREINNSIRALYPMVYGIGTHEITLDPTRWQYELPADVEIVVNVEWKWDNLDGWNRLKSWDVTHSANTTDFPSGKMLSLSDPLMSGITVRVTYSKQPSLLVNSTDPFSNTGLPATCRDLVVYGAASRLLPWLDAGRLPVDTVASDALDSTKPVGNAIAVGREIRTLYARRLSEERASLLSRYPLRAHKVR